MASTNQCHGVAPLEAVVVGKGITTRADDRIHAADGDLRNVFGRIKTTAIPISIVETAETIAEVM